MKTYTISKGKHAAKPRMWAVWRNKKSLAYRVTFDLNCKYNLGLPDQLDVNKLFGIGYLWHHHKDSARFGWRYNPDKNRIELFAYCYRSGNRVIEYMTDVDFNRSYDLTIAVHFDSYLFTVRKDGGVFTKEVKHYHEKKIGYALDVYFGGNQTCPHQMNIYLRKL